MNMFILKSIQISILVEFYIHHLEGWLWIKCQTPPPFLFTPPVTGGGPELVKQCLGTALSCTKLSDWLELSLPPACSLSGCSHLGFMRAIVAEEVMLGCFIMKETLYFNCREPSGPSLLRSTSKKKTPPENDVSAAAPRNIYLRCRFCSSGLRVKWRKLSRSLCGMCIFLFFYSHPYSKTCLGSTSLIAPQGPGNIGDVVRRGRLQVW